MSTFAFRFDPLYRVLAAPFGISPRTSGLQLDDGTMTVRFGPWLVETSLDNIAGCQRSGGFALPKTAGPAHLSMADRGLTFATNPDDALCIRFTEPVAGFDPWGVIRSPGLTVTVDRPDELAEALEGAGTAPADDAVLMQSPQHLVRQWFSWPVGMVRALAGYPRILAAVDRSDGRLEAAVDGSGRDGPDVQRLDDGVGPVVVRRYRVRIRTSVTPDELIERFARNLDVVGPTGVARFVEQQGGTGGAPLDHEYEVQMPGPWNGPVRVIEHRPTSIRLCTLDGHMEAGEIEFATWSEDEPAGPVLVFQVESTARSGDRIFSVLYDRLRLAREMQLFMWVSVCLGVVDLVGGRRDRKIAVETIEITSPAGSSAALAR